MSVCVGHVKPWFGPPFGQPMSTHILHTSKLVKISAPFCHCHETYSTSHRQPDFTKHSDSSKKLHEDVRRQSFAWVNRYSHQHDDAWPWYCGVGVLMWRSAGLMWFLTFQDKQKNPSAWNFLSPKPEVTCVTVAIIIRVVLLSPYLGIRAVSLSSIHYNQSHRVYINRRRQYICLIWN